jgi:hypothetical protein
MRMMAFDKLCQLIGMASPTSRLITPDKNTTALIAGGLIAEDNQGFAITANGLRSLADQMEAGHVKRAIDRLKREHRERAAKKSR